MAGINDYFDFGVRKTYTDIAQDWFIGIVTLFVMFGGTLPFCFQYREIQNSQNSRGFSLYVCLALLSANILRIMFWIGKRYETQLLVQSFAMICCMLFLVELTVRVKHGGFYKNFWQWHDFSSYMVFVSAMASFLSLITVLMVESQFYVELIGALALLTEALLGTPQFIKNYQRGSTHGMSIRMVLMWLTGDISKVAYFVVRQTPTQFWLCGCLQITMDLAILFQVFYYRVLSPKSNRLRQLPRAGDSSKSTVLMI